MGSGAQFPLRGFLKWGLPDHVHEHILTMAKLHAATDTIGLRAPSKSFSENDLGTRAQHLQSECTAAAPLKGCHARRCKPLLASRERTLDVAPVPGPGLGQTLVKTRFLSVDPYMRGWIGS